MLEQIQNLIESGKLSAVNLKVSVENGAPVVQMSIQTNGVDVSVLESTTGLTEEAREQVLAVRSNLARPAVYKGTDIAAQIQQDIPVLAGSYAQANETLDALSIAAKLDGATAKDKATAEKAQKADDKAAEAKKPAAKAPAKTATKAGDAEADAKKDAPTATTDNMDSNDTAEPKASADDITSQYDISSL